MSPRDWFLVGIRVIGVWILYDGFDDLTILAGYALTYTDTFTKNVNDTVFRLWHGTTIFGMGLYFVFGGEGLTKWVFGELKSKEDSDTDME